MAWSTIQTARKTHKLLKALEKGNYDAFVKRLAEVHQYAAAKGKHRDLRLAAMAYLLGVQTRHTQIVESDPHDFMLLDDTAQTGLQLCDDLPEDCKPTFTLGLEACRVLHHAATGNYSAQSRSLATVIKHWPQLGSSLHQDQPIRNGDITDVMPIVEALERAIVGCLIAGRIADAQFLQDCSEQLVAAKMPGDMEPLIHAKALNVALMAGNHAEVGRLVAALDRYEQLHPDLIHLGEVPAQREEEEVVHESSQERMLRFALDLERLQAKAWLSIEQGDDAAAQTMWQSLAQSSHRVPQLAAVGIAEALSIQSAFCAARRGDYATVDQFTGNFVVPEGPAKLQNTLKVNTCTLQVYSAHHQHQFEQAAAASLQLAELDIIEDPPFPVELEAYGYAAWHVAHADSSPENAVSVQKVVQHVAGRLRQSPSPRNREQAFSRNFSILEQARVWSLAACQHLTQQPNTAALGVTLGRELHCAWRDFFYRSAVTAAASSACGATNATALQAMSSLDSLFFAANQRVIGATMTGLGSASTQNAPTLHQASFSERHQQLSAVWPRAATIVGQHRLLPPDLPAAPPAGQVRVVVDDVTAPTQGSWLTIESEQGGSVATFIEHAQGAEAVHHQIATAVAGAAAELHVCAAPSTWAASLLGAFGRGPKALRMSPFLPHGSRNQFTATVPQPTLVVPHSESLRSAHDVLLRASDQGGVPTSVVLPGLVLSSPGVDIVGILAAYAALGAQQVACLVSPISEPESTAVAHALNGVGDLAVSLHQLRCSQSQLTTAAQSYVVFDI